MKKRTLVMVGILFIFAIAVTTNAFAAEGTSAWNGMWESVGGFLYNALPWNWGNWMGAK